MDSPSNSNDETIMAAPEEHDGPMNIEESPIVGPSLFAGGLFAIVTSIYSIILCNLQLTEMLMYFDTLSLGIIVCILESPHSCCNCMRPFRNTLMIRQKTMEAIPMLKYLSGRGAFYIFIGTIEMTLPSLMNCIIGVYLIIMGIIYIIIGILMQQMKKTDIDKKNNRSLKRYFRRFDKDMDGVLNVSEFIEFMIHVTGPTIGEYDLVETFRTIDTSHKGYVTMDEMRIWWTKFKSDQENEKGLEGTEGYVTMA